jgi:hypothetical protein
MAAILLASCLALGAESEFRPPRVDGTWALSDGWTGYMGIALVIEGDKFKYWFYSDVRSPNEPKYPIRGKVTYRSNSIQLSAEDKGRLYADVWRFVVHEGEICLLADEHLADHRPPKSPSDRLLHKISDKVEETPMMNRPFSKRR